MGTGVSLAVQRALAAMMQQGANQQFVQGGGEGIPGLTRPPNPGYGSMIPGVGQAPPPSIPGGTPPGGPPPTGMQPTAPPGFMGSARAPTPVNGYYGMLAQLLAGRGGPMQIPTQPNPAMPPMGFNPRFGNYGPIKGGTQETGPRRDIHPFQPTPPMVY